MEASSTKNDESLMADITAGSPVGLVSLLDNASTAAEQRSVPHCLCVTSISSVSPTHLTDCLLNSVMSSSAQVQMINKHSVSGGSDRRLGWFMNFITARQHSLLYRALH